MKVTTLFHSKNEYNCPSEEELFRLLDEPETCKERLAFLNHCSLCQPCMETWQLFTQAVDAGSQLSSYRPDPAIRSGVLDAAYADLQSPAAQPAVGSGPKKSWWNIPGWKLAWAALFLVMSWSVTLQLENPGPVELPAEDVEAQILTLQEEIDQLQADLGLEIEELAEEMT